MATVALPGFSRNFQLTCHPFCPNITTGRLRIEFSVIMRKFYLFWWLAFFSDVWFFFSGKNPSLYNTMLKYPPSVDLVRMIELDLIVQLRLKKECIWVVHAHKMRSGPSDHRAHVASYMVPMLAGFPRGVLWFIGTAD